jgi:hypothetical protein
MITVRVRRRVRLSRQPERAASATIASITHGQIR